MSDKLDDLPKGKPHSYEDVMKAMAVLHKLVLKQAAAYGGKNSKYLPAHVVEGGSLLQSFEEEHFDPLYEGDEVDRLMDIVHSQAESLADHLKKMDDKVGMNKLGGMLKMLGAASGASHANK